MTTDGEVSVLEHKYWVEYNSDEELAAEVLFPGYPKGLLYFASACCVLFTLVGIPGNLTTIIALARYKKVRNATAIFIINLHISDLIFCCLILPVTAMTYSQKHWTHGLIMCHVYPFFKYVLNAVTILSILLITINRYVIFCHPLWYPRLYKRRNISIMLIIVWMSSFALFLPSIFGVWGRFHLEPNGGFCTMIEDKHNHSPKKLILIIAFIGPYLIIVLCYTHIWWVVRKTTNKSKGPITRPAHLPLSHTQSGPSNDGNKLISDESSSCQNNVTDNNSHNNTAASSKGEIARPTYLSLSDTQPDPSNYGNKLVISSEVSVCETSITEDSNSGNNTAASTPTEGKIIEKIFKAPFRITRKELRSKTPMKRDKKLCTMIAAIMISFCISRLPIMATRIIHKEYKQHPECNVLAHLFENLGNCMNPIIYVLMSSEYRQAYKSLLDSVRKKFRA